MNNIRKYAAWLGASAIILTMATGCPAPVESTSNVVEAGIDSTANMADGAADTTTNMADAAGNNMAEGVDAAGNMADAAGTNMAQGAEAAGGAIANAGEAATFTPKIKTALGAEKALQGSNIDVDTLGAKDTIALRGTVTSEAQKSMAEAIAKKQAPNFKIDNQLTMGGAM